MLTGAPPADVTRAEQPLGHYPGILDPLARAAGVQGDSDVQPPPHPRKPSPSGQVDEELASLVVIDPEDPRRVGDIEGAMGATVQLLQQHPVPPGDPSA